MPEETSQDHDLVREIVEVAKRLSRPFDLKDVLEQIVDTGRAVLDTDRASLLLYDEERGELYSKATSAREEIRFPATKGIAGETLANRKIIRIDDCYADPRFNPEIDRLTGYRTNTLISVPLIGADDHVVGVMQALNVRKGRFDDQDERLADLFARLAALAIQRAQAFADRVRKVKLEADLDLARDIQLGLLPAAIPECEGYDLAVFSQPAEETGGDIYDLIPQADSGALTILLADATGHGIGAAISVTQVRSMLRMASRLGTDLDTLASHLGDQLADDLPSSKFVTIFLGSLDPARHTIQYHSLGQAPLLHYSSAEGQCRWLSASAIPAGLMSGIPLTRPKPVELAPGDLFVLLSDGFYEYENPEQQQMGKELVGELIHRHAAQPATEILGKLRAGLWDFARGAPQDDDLTAIILKRVP